MADLVPLAVKEANLLRERVRQLVALRNQLLESRGPETVHDLRVASRRLREVLDYLEPSLPRALHRKTRRLARRVTRALGSLRETEVDIALVQGLVAKAEISSLAGEVILRALDADRAEFEEAVGKEIASPSFETYEELPGRFAASLKMPPTPATMLQRRAADFLEFELPPDARDEQLHLLRIATKKFRYAVEIYDRLHRRNLGRFLLRVKSLQDVLGQEHDWFVLQNRIERELATWTRAEFTQIRGCLEQALQTVRSHKLSLFPRVPAAYQHVTDNVPAEILLLSATEQPPVVAPQEVVSE